MPRYLVTGAGSGKFDGFLYIIKAGSKADVLAKILASFNKEGDVWALETFNVTGQHPSGKVTLLWDKTDRYQSVETIREEVKKEVRETGYVDELKCGWEVEVYEINEEEEWYCYPAQW